MNRLLKYLFISTILVTHGTMSAFSFKKLYGYVVPSKMPQEIVYEEYPAKKVTKVTIHNKAGNISIKTDQNQPAVLLKAVKKALEEEQLAHHTIAQKVVGQEMFIDIDKEATTSGSVDLNLIIPATVAVSVSTDNGSIFFKESRNPITACTGNGSIEIRNAHSTVEATTQQKGSIAIYKPYDHVKANTQHGNIIIKDACSTIVANTTYGNIQLFAKEVPSTSLIKLSSVAGSVSVHLPPETNADIQASTEHGTIFSDHFITLKPQTTQLNRYTWKRLQRHIDGTLGTGEAQIKVSSVRNDIKLLELKA